MKEKSVILIVVVVTILFCFGTYQTCKLPVQAEAVVSTKITMGQEDSDGRETQADQIVQGEQGKQIAKVTQDEPALQEQEARQEQETRQAPQEQEVPQGQQALQEQEERKGEEEAHVFRAGSDRQTGEVAKLTGLDVYSSGVVLQYAEKYDIKPSLLLAMMRVESNFHQYAVGKSQDRGYFQIIPASEKAMANMFGSEIGMTYDPGKIFDPDYNIGLAAAYIHWLQNKYKSDLHRVLSEYNKGPGKLAAYHEENGTYETAYSRKVIGIEQKYDKSLSY